MSGLALAYLGKNFKFSQPLECIERDFSNGYLFMMILFQQGYIDLETYELVSDVLEPEAVLRNFQVLSKVLRPHGIKLSRSMVANIIAEIPSVAANLVLHLKTIFEKHDMKDVLFDKSVKSMKKNANLNATTKTERGHSGSNDVKNDDEEALFQRPKYRFLDESRNMLKHNRPLDEIDDFCYLSDYRMTFH